MAKLYTHEHILTAVNAGADLVTHDEHMELGEYETDLINLVVNASMTMLDDPNAALDDVMDENYDGGAAEVRSWWDGWS